MRNFVQPGDVVTVTASAGVTSGDLIVAATLPVLDPIGTATVRLWLDGVEVVAAGA